MSKSTEVGIVEIESMTLSDHQGHYNRNPAQSKNSMIKLNTNAEILTQTKLFTQTTNELTNKPSKLEKQLKKMHEMPTHMHIEFCELCSGDQPTQFFPQADENVNFVGNKKMLKKYQNNFQRNNKLNQG